MGTIIKGFKRLSVFSHPISQVVSHSLKKDHDKKDRTSQCDLSVFIYMFLIHRVDGFYITGA